MAGERPDHPGDGNGPAVADMLAELAEAEAAEADALADAAQARARAAEVRPDTEDPIDSDADGDSSDEPPAADDHPTAPPARRPRVRQTAALAVAALLTAAALTLTALMLWQHSRVSAQRAADQRFVDAARDGIVALLSIEHTHAREDVQRVLDLSTGQFHDDFATSADDFVKTAEESKAVTKGSVNVAALERIDGDQAVVLLAATSEVSNANGARQDPRPFRISVTVTREGQECKMSDVEFVP